MLSVRCKSLSRARHAEDGLGKLLEILKYIQSQDTRKINCNQFKSKPESQVPNPSPAQPGEIQARKTEGFKYLQSGQRATRNSGSLRSV